MYRMGEQRSQYGAKLSVAKFYKTNLPSLEAKKGGPRARRGVHRSPNKKIEFRVCPCSAALSYQRVGLRVMERSSRAKPCFRLNERSKEGWARGVCGPRQKLSQHLSDLCAEPRRKTGWVSKVRMVGTVAPSKTRGGPQASALA